jgi:sensor c-di-GMP phosphodiesterase-like protein
LTYLKRLPVDKVKIDQSFVRSIYDSSDGAVIVEAVITMANKFDLQVIAEGVEKFIKL